MLHEQTKSHIRSLSDADLLHYVLTGRRVYEAEALGFAQAELERRAIPEARLAILRPAILAELAAMDAGAEPDPTRPQAPAVVCQRCGVEAPLAYFEYRQNIGLGVVRYQTIYRGMLCKRCSNRLFLKTSAITLLVGWNGAVSAFIMPAFLLQNTMQFLSSLGLGSLPKNTPPPAVDDLALAAIAPHLDEITSRMLAGDEAPAIARDVAAKSGLTPGQVWCYLQATARNQFRAQANLEQKGIRI